MVYTECLKIISPFEMIDIYTEVKLIYFGIELKLNAVSLFNEQILLQEVLF